MEEEKANNQRATWRAHRAPRRRRLGPKSDVSIDVASRVCSFRTELRKYCSTFSLRGTASRAKPTKKWPGFHNSRAPPPPPPPPCCFLPVSCFSFFFLFSPFLLIVCQARIGRRSHRKVRAFLHDRSSFKRTRIFVQLGEEERILRLNFVAAFVGYAICASTFCHSMITKHRVEYDKPWIPLPPPLITTTDRPTPIQSTKQCASYVFCAWSRNPNYKGDPD